MNLNEKLQQLKQNYDVVTTVDLDLIHEMPLYKVKPWFSKILESVYKKSYDHNERIVFTLTLGDRYKENDPVGVILKELQLRLNDADISNFFVVLVTNDVTIFEAYQDNFSKISLDPVPITIDVYDAVITKKIPLGPQKYEYSSPDPVSASLDSMTEKERYLLSESKTFCMYPWVHLHAYPTGAAYPCCMSEMDYPVGDMRKNTMKEIWNQAPMRDIRKSMLNDSPVEACVRCYEKEQAGFFSGRQSANKHHGHHISRVHNTKDDGTLEEFNLIYWDIRFSNLCNLRCRSCGHIFSSQWYQDQVKLAGPEWAKKNRVLNYAGRHEMDAWEQLVEHIDHVEQIYFAGGEPLIMEEHYRILEELERRQKFDVRLIYNTNFTEMNLKDRLVFDYWKKFDSVSVGASLDGMGKHGEYIRKGTKWDQVEENRRKMIEICPQVDFYVSSTLSILNAWHLPDFHKDWVEKKLIRPQDFNINLLQDPPHYRLDIAPTGYKQKIKDKFESHVTWLKERDNLRRATKGYESAINFMMNTDNSDLLSKFWHKTQELDQIRNENLLDAIPELADLT